MYEEIIKFWFDKLEPKQWWVKDPALDQIIIDRYATIHKQAACCELVEWRQKAEGRLAEIIVLDQFSRNMFRASPLAFAQDSLSLALAQEAISTGADQLLTPVERNFLYMPFMHSESLIIHEQAVELFRRNGQQASLDYEYKHKTIIERFGRYPHRNDLLGRTSTAEEIAFLQQPGSRF